MSEPEELDDADWTVALDILAMRLECLKLAAQESMDPEGIVTLTKYYFDHVLTGLVVPYPISPDGRAKKPRAVQ